jgi:hypothetical protein
LVTGCPTQRDKFALKPRGELGLIDEAEHALIELLKQAADNSKESVGQAMTVAHRLFPEFRTAEGRVRELEAEVERLESARRAPSNGWER